MKLLLLFVGFVLLLAPETILGQEPCCKMQLSADTTEKELSAEFTRLKAERDKDCCRKYGSDYMKILPLLGNRISIGEKQKHIIRLMGPPDVVSQTTYSGVSPGEGETILVYTWRGQRDFYYFTIRKKRVVEKRWYFAYE